MFFKKAKKILIVEDDVLVAELLLDNVKSLDCYKVFIAYDGAVGWELAKKEKPDLVIQDIGLPSLDGISLCRLIKSNVLTNTARVIMLTGKKNVGDMEDAFQAGADAYVNKPFNWDQVLAHMQKMLPE